MTRSKIFIHIFVLIILISSMEAQTVDYIKIIADLTKNAKNEHEYEDIIADYFESLDDYELPVALGVITTDKEYHNTTHLIGMVYYRFKSQTFTAGMIKEIGLKSNSAPFKIATIECVEDFIEERNNSKELESFNNVTYEIAVNKTFPERLREYAAARTGYSPDYNNNKKSLINLLNDDNIRVKNGAAKTIRRLFDQDSSKIEVDNWVDLLINEMAQKSDLSQYKSLIITLGYSKSNKAKDYLLNILEQNSDLEIIARSLGNYHDPEVVSTIFNVYSEDKENFDFGKELLLSEIVKENKKILKQYSYSKNDNDKIVYLRGTRLLYSEKNTKSYADETMNLLSDSSENIRYEAIKTIHFLLPHEEEKEIYLEHLKTEASDKVKNLIFSYIGYTDQN